MGILFIFLFGIIAILIIAKFASKVRPEEEILTRGEIGQDARATSTHDLVPEIEKEDQIEALVSLLIKKGVFSRKELSMEMERRKNKKDVL